MDEFFNIRKKTYKKYTDMNRTSFRHKKEILEELELAGDELKKTKIPIYNMTHNVCRGL